MTSSLVGSEMCLLDRDEDLRKETGLPVMIADDPLATVVMGAGKLLSDSALLLKVAVN
jgi:rod shape-determining protein MreB